MQVWATSSLKTSCCARDAISSSNTKDCGIDEICSVRARIGKAAGCLPRQSRIRAAKAEPVWLHNFSLKMESKATKGSERSSHRGWGIRKTNLRGNGTFQEVDWVEGDWIGKAYICASLLWESASSCMTRKEVCTSRSCFLRGACYGFYLLEYTGKACCAYSLLRNRVVMQKL
jgi:hypothetical protein